MKCSECGKEIQSDKKLCKEFKKRLLREKIISDTYGRDVLHQHEGYSDFD